MKNLKISEKISAEEQVPAEENGCSNDCLEYRGVSRYEAEMIANQAGVSTIDPTMDEIKKGVAAAKEMGIPYCYGIHTPKSSIYI